MSPPESENDRIARIYRSEARDKALQAYPQLKVAYAAEDKLRAIAAEAKPITPAVAVLIDQSVRTSVESAIRRGAEPQVTPQGAAALRFHVAHRSLEHAVGHRLMHKDSALQLSPEHRELLVRHAESAMTRVVSNPRGVDALSNDKILAREVAGSLATLDHPKVANPFVEKSLRDIYDRQIQYKEHLAARDNQKQRPADRDR